MEVSIMDETQKIEIIPKYISSYNSFDIEGKNLWFWNE
jgi:hypothetical protein